MKQRVINKTKDKLEGTRMRSYRQKGKKEYYQEAARGRG